MKRIIGRKFWLAVGCFALGTVPASSFGQGNIFNPYGNSGYADYREFATPMYANNPALPGQARIQAMPLGERPISRANQLEDYFDRFDDLGDPSTTPSGKRGASAPGVPYYRTFRQYDQQYNRVYTPNNTKADQDFAARAKRRELNYAEALKETDPAKRARLLRQIDQDSLASPRTTAAARGTAKAKSTTTKPGTPKASAPSARVTAPPPPSTAPAGSVPYPAGVDPSLSGSRPRTKASRPRPTTPPVAPAPAPG